MRRLHHLIAISVTLTLSLAASLAQAQERVVDLASRPGVTLRMLYTPTTAAPRAAAVLLAGGHGSLRIYPNGTFGWGDRGFLVRAREHLVQQGIAVLVLDAPSDKRGGLTGWRHSPEHAQDVGAAIAWLREQGASSVWLVGHSRGSESATSAAVTLGAAPKGPDGLVLASSILTETMFAPGKAVTAFPLQQLKLPVLVLHHERDGCPVTQARDLPPLLTQLTARKDAPAHQLVQLQGGSPSAGGCDHESHHGFGGQDAEAMGAIAAAILAPSVKPVVSPAGAVSGASAPR